MKTFLVFVAVLFVSFSYAQKHSSYSQSINDDGKKMSITIKGDIGGKTVVYDRTFDVTGWTDKQKEKLKARIYDSLGLEAPVPPKPPVAPRAIAAPGVAGVPEPVEVPEAIEPPAPVVKVKAVAAPKVVVAPAPVVEVKASAAPKIVVAPAPVVEIIPPVDAAPVVMVVNDFDEYYAIGGDHPYTKEIKYNPSTGSLYMKYRFTKKGEDVTYERTVDAKDKSKEERNEIIKKYEKEIGLLKTEKL